MQSATANTPMNAPRSVIVTRAATIQHQDRIRVGFAYLTRKAANCDLILPNALSSAERASACSLASVFAAVAALEKDSFSSGDWRTNSFACALFNQVCKRSVSSAERSTRSFTTARNFDTASRACCNKASVKPSDGVNDSSAARANSRGTTLNPRRVRTNLLCGSRTSRLPTLRRARWRP